MTKRISGRHLRKIVLKGMKTIVEGKSALDVKSDQAIGVPKDRRSAFGHIVRNIAFLSLKYPVSLRGDGVCFDISMIIPKAGDDGKIADIAVVSSLSPADRQYPETKLDSAKEHFTPEVLEKLSDSLSNKLLSDFNKGNKRGLEDDKEYFLYAKIRDSR